MKLFAPLYELKGVGPKFAERLTKFGIHTIKDLLWHFPSRYEDFSRISKIADLKIGESATIQGVISAVKLKRTWKRRMFIVEVLITDDTGSIKAIWFNQRFLLGVLKKGRLVNLAGKVGTDPEAGICLVHPIYELTDYGLQTTVKDKEAVVGSLSTVDQLKHTGRLVPIYPETKRLTSKGLRLLIKISLDNLEELPEPIPPHVLAERNFPEINAALRQIHFPENLKEARIAKKRFAFEDLFLLQLVNIRQRLRLSKERACSFPADIPYLKSLLQKLPFELTKSQKVSLWDILKDLEKPHPMNRLLQGDVGSGKTIVSALAAILVARGNKPFDAAQGKQSAFMAPTEVLARQHYLTFKKFFPDFDLGIGLLTGSEAKIFYGEGLESAVKKTEVKKRISDGGIKIVIGTHALIQGEISFSDLAFVVVDEQHRFGVRQRAELLKNNELGIVNSESKNKKEQDKFIIHNSKFLIPHFLSMSATPIPRTLTLTIFGDLDLSIIDELPSGRKKIITKIVAPGNRDKAYAFIRGQVKKGRQAFVICPRIEKEEDTEGRILSSQEISRLEMKNVKEEYEKLSKKIFPDLRVGLLHGKLKAKEKAEVMDKFKRGEMDILVSTSVVEVGVDVPNATIMMIEGSDWFGLAQLYQFRGRVGRGEYQSFCFLFTDSGAKSTFKRLQAIINAKSGFELAEMDLEIRGPGEFLGESQTGLPDLAMKAVQNPDLMKAGREAAEKILNADPELKKYPLLLARLEGFEKEIHLE
ncbi:ATP-dependent DNA helicase RecG [Candidatus Wolfebacteria bacterium]|nr:ATP-dependent DNA helicase RecG [Candidatus Wolfebacteria bacterium]